jgi:hypothetical protein
MDTGIDIERRFHNRFLISLILFDTMCAYAGRSYETNVLSLFSIYFPVHSYHFPSANSLC